MSDLKKLALTVKNYNLQASGELDSLYSKVRCEDDSGNTFHFKSVLLLDYLKGHGALVRDTPRTWYYKSLGKNKIVIIAIEKSGGKIEYDLDNMRSIVKSSIVKGIIFVLAAVPAGIIMATATFGLGLLFIPFSFYAGYKLIFKVPAMLSRKTLISDLAAYGVVVR